MFHCSIATPLLRVWGHGCVYLHSRCLFVIFKYPIHKNLVLESYLSYNFFMLKVARHKCLWKRIITMKSEQISVDICVHANSARTAYFQVYTLSQSVYSLGSSKFPSPWLIEHKKVVIKVHFNIIFIPFIFTKSWCMTVTRSLLWYWYYVRHSVY